MIRQEERLEMLERAVDHLVDLNRVVPVLVEGKRDVAALRELGLSGQILVVNAGRPIVELCDDLAERYPAIVLLVDWDRTGGQLMRRIGELLKGRVDLHREIRRDLAVYAEVADVESMASYLSSLRRKVAQLTRTPHERGTPQTSRSAAQPLHPEGESDPDRDRESQRAG